MIVLLCTLIVPLTGCGSIMTGKYQVVPVTSEPPGAKVRADFDATILTPGKLHLIRNKEHTLLAEYPSHEPQQIKLHNKAQGWVWGNILLGGVIGLAIDCASGASDELIPKEVHFNFLNPELTTKEAIKIENKEESPEESTPDSKKQAQEAKESAEPVSTKVASKDEGT